MITRTITCDHCGKKCDEAVAMPLPYGFRPAEYVPDYVHGCSKEHLGFAVAKLFGIPIDGNMAAKLDEYRASNAALTKSVEQLQAEWNEQHQKLTTARAQLREYEQRMALVPPPGPDARQIEAENLTDPQKPTKPGVRVMFEGDPPPEAIEKLAKFLKDEMGMS